MTRFVRIDTAAVPPISPASTVFVGIYETLPNGRVRLTGRFMMDEDQGKVVREHEELYEVDLHGFATISIKDLTEKEYFLELLKWEI